MSEQGTLLHADEAIRFIETIEDPVTRSLVNMAFVHFVKQLHLEKRDPPRADLDALFLVRTLRDFFSEHDILDRTLRGEKVGAWFEEDYCEGPGQALIVLEATGGYEIPVVAALSAAALPVVVVNARQTREFARAVGKIAKTDAIDATVLAHFAEAVRHGEAAA